MLSEKPWKENAVVKLLLVVLGCIIGLSLMATVLAELTGHSATEVPLALDLALGTTAMQAVVLVMVHLFLREHGVRWPHFLGLGGPRLGHAALLALAVSVVVIPVTWLL